MIDNKESEKQILSGSAEKSDTAEPAAVPSAPKSSGRKPAEPALSVRQSDGLVKKLVICGLLTALAVVLGGLLSISWGVRLAHALPERVLRGLFCGFLVLCALLLALE